MRILTLHVDYIKFKPLKKALKDVRKLSDKEKKGSGSKEALVVLTAVERGDKNIKKVVSELIKNIKEVSKQVRTKEIVLYPYAHLSSNLASPDLAEKVLDDAEKELKKNFKVTRAPFGYYKEFELKVKGHPLSELSREINVEGEGKSMEEKYDAKQLLREISKSKLDTSKIKQNDHRIIGKQMDLFSFNEVAPGMPFWHHNGLVICNKLIEFMREELEKEDYKEIRTPEVLENKLWKISGHWEKYRENIFVSEYEKRAFAAKPMNCPGGLLVFKEKPKSYKDLPLRVAEFGILHRQELSGVLAGLFRVVEFTQDDAHIFCTEKQVEEEVLRLMKLLSRVYKKFNFNYSVEFSTRPKKRIGNDAMWSKAERFLENVLKKNKIKYKLNKGEGAFYGPKIDFCLKDSLDRTWQLGTIQVDLSMPERFNLEYTDIDNKKKRPVMLHRAIFGSLERFIGILLEHTNGRLPTWLAPVQVRVLSFTDRQAKYVEDLTKKLKKEIPDLRVDSDIRATTIPSKVKDAELMRVPYIIVMGDKEEKSKTMAVRTKGGKVRFGVKQDAFVKNLRKEIDERK